MRPHIPGLTYKPILLWAPPFARSYHTERSSLPGPAIDGETAKLLLCSDSFSQESSENIYKDIKIRPVLIIAGLFFLASPYFAQTYVSGSISQDTVWTTAGSPYVATGDVTVQHDVTLTLAPGPGINSSGIWLNAEALIENGTSTPNIILHHAWIRFLGIKHCWDRLTG